MVAQQMKAQAGAGGAAVGPGVSLGGQGAGRPPIIQP